jgi:hypothetical protein
MENKNNDLERFARGAYSPHGTIDGTDNDVGSCRTLIQVQGLPQVKTILAPNSGASSIN